MNLKHSAQSILAKKTELSSNQLIFIRTLFNTAIKEGIVSRKLYPFGGEKEKIRIDSENKIGLTAKEVQRIEKLELKKNTNIWHAHYTWLFSFYFAGMRISDVVKMRWSDFKDDRLYYVMDKNKKAVSLKIPDKAKEILKLYQNHKKQNNGYIFPFLKDANPDIRKIFSSKQGMQQSF